MTQRLQTLQDWSNKHVFTASMDYWNQEPPEVESYEMRREKMTQRQPNYEKKIIFPFPTDSPPFTNFRNSLMLLLPGTVEEGPEGEDSPPTEIHEVVDEDPHAGGEPITALQAAWNVTNAIQGMFIVGLPIAVKVGGWWSVAAMMGVAYICYWTGVLLIECLYEKDKKVRFSYREVAEFYRPGFGKWVLAAQLTELLSTCIIYLVLAADLLQSCFPSIDKPAWMMIVSAVLLSCAFLDSLVMVSQLSFANAISHLVVNAIMMIYCLSEVISQRFSWLSIVVHFTEVEPKEFKWMLKWSHVAAALFKAIFGLCGYLTFGELTQPEISNSLPNQSFKVVVNLVLVIKALLSYPLPFYAAVQLLKDNLFRGTKTTPFTGYSIPLPGTMLSFIWPALFHLRIKGDKMVDRDRRFDQMIIGLGSSICISGIYFSFMELLRAIRADDR
ncbi:transmembrane amino acid transporter protein [Necator americanus]|uniref:Transmembrane amino acid transporter protein n=1 Tax=Necator americanus TaxID=51031 RepID=W2TE60_NECAM|nr:transmembrane amino acid transporter protein [Necator americanus]ETN79874.1 transmembrane amino acid transporter protein [Necator americanus]